MDFLPDFFNIGTNIEGNLSAVGMVENDLEDKIYAIVQELQGYGLCVPAWMVTEKLEEYNIDYPMLPQYLKDELDLLEVY